MLHRNLRGKDLHSPSRELVENNTGSTLSALSCVTFDGYGTAYPQVVLATAPTTVIRGVVSADILTGKTGYITALGLLDGINTSLWTANTKLYCSGMGNLSSAQLGLPVGIVLKQDAVNGIIYVDNTGITAADITAATSFTSWALTGSSVLPTDFLGTTNNQDLRIRTNNIQKAVITTDGRFGLGELAPKRHFQQKSHVGPGTGLQSETWTVNTATPSYVQAYSVTLSDPSVVRFDFVAMANQDDGTGRASFTRSGVIYRSSSNVQIEGQTWQSNHTVKSNNGFNVTYQLTPTAIIFKVKAPTGSDVTWMGHIIVEEL